MSDLRGAIFGVITATAVITAAASHDEPPGRILVTTVATLVVFWLAHVYAAVLADHLSARHRPRLSTVSTAMRRESPILEAPLPSVILLGVGTLGLLRASLAVDLALWAGPAQLVAWGTAYALQQGWRWPTAVAAGLVNGAFGSAVVLLKALLH